MLRWTAVVGLAVGWLGRAPGAVVAVAAVGRRSLSCYLVGAFAKERAGRRGPAEVAGLLADDAGDRPR